MINKMKSVKGLVATILSQHKHTRDDDNMLMLFVWIAQNPKLKGKEFTFREFGETYMHGGYANTESVRRMRQKLQEEDPNLRGTKYAKRHKESEIIRKEINLT